MKRLLLLLVVGLLAGQAAATPYVVTAYCACKKCCGPTAHGKTASGKRPVQGVTVAAPRSMPLGTVLEIAGVGRRVVQDRTAEKYDGRIDVYFKRHRDAKRFGIKTLSVITKPSS